MWYELDNSLVLEGLFNEEGRREKLLALKILPSATRAPLPSTFR
jgi:hypothetical protein